MKTHWMLFLGICLSSCSPPAAVKQTPSTICNPLNLDYGWGRFQSLTSDVRSAADPVVVLFKDKYYLFTTMDIGGYRVSDDLITWKNIYFDTAVRDFALNGNHYTAPAVAADERYIYFVKYNRNRSQPTVDVLRSSDPESGQWERCGKVKRMADPTLLIDNGRFFFYHGLGPDHPISCFEVDTTFMEIPGTEKAIRHPITGIDLCIEGYHFGRRELYDEIDASSWKGRFKWLPCPEGAWVIRRHNKYYLQYATPGTICQWYCDAVMVSDHPDGPFQEAAYNPVSLKVGGFIGGAGHSSVFRDKYGNWWQATTMWVGNHEPFERRIALFPVSFDEKDRMRVHTTLGDYPIEVPQYHYCPSDLTVKDWMIQSFRKKCIASSELLGKEADKASDENSRTWWSAQTGEQDEYLAMDFGKEIRIHAVQVNFAEQDIDTSRIFTTDYHAYKLYVSNDGKKWRLLLDKTTNRKAVPHDYAELTMPVNASWMKIENVHTPRNGKFALLDLRVFGHGNATPPAVTENVTVQRHTEDERFASLSWSKVSDADGYLVRFGYAPDFLNQCIQVKGNETTSLLLHILIKGVKYCYRIDSYNDSGISEGQIIKES
ncbi:MAG: family 43 glycosylhydrolase [Bacteroidales bacterium]|jgi:hypothetical protein|nr:family 43 glycosylhydrolase [Bacteroidales bacterium]